MLAHDWKKKPRTNDVRASDDVRFESFMLSQPVLAGLKKCGFRRPSPVQALGIPAIKTDSDCIIQAKSGTGKTCVFVIAALEKVNVASPATQALILAPTREVAVQIAQTCLWMGSALPELKAFAFIGGLSTDDDILKCRRCHIVVGTPGRVAWLLQHGYINAKNVKLWVLDEADKMLDKGMRTDVEYIAKRMPRNKQVICCSATFHPSVERTLTSWMKNPSKVKISEGDVNLVGIRQFVVKVPHHPQDRVVVKRKFTALLSLLQGQSFSQCMAFSNFQTRAEALSADSEAAGWPSACLAGHLDQRTRLKALSDLQRMNCRILFATDVGARGIDVENVDLVLNFDVPSGPEWYLHRVGRAGRFGSAGLAVSLVSGPNEEAAFLRVIAETGSKVRVLGSEFDGDLWTVDLDALELFEPSAKPEEPVNGVSVGIELPADVDEVESLSQESSELPPPSASELTWPKFGEPQNEDARLTSVVRKARRAMTEDNLRKSARFPLAAKRDVSGSDALFDCWAASSSSRSDKLRSWLAEHAGDDDFRDILVRYQAAVPVRRATDESSVAVGDHDEFEEEEEDVDDFGDENVSKLDYWGGEEVSPSEPDPAFSGEEDELGGGDFAENFVDEPENYAVYEDWDDWFSSFMEETYAVRDAVFEHEYEKALNEFW